MQEVLFLIGGLIQQPLDITQIEHQGRLFEDIDFLLTRLFGQLFDQIVDVSGLIQIGCGSIPGTEELGSGIIGLESSLLRAFGLCLEQLGTGKIGRILGVIALGMRLQLSGLKLAGLFLGCLLLFEFLFARHLHLGMDQNALHIQGQLAKWVGQSIL